MEASKKKQYEARRLAIDLLKGGVGPTEVRRQVEQQTGVKIYNSWMYLRITEIKNGQEPSIGTIGKGRKIEKGRKENSPIKIVQHKMESPVDAMDRALSEIVRIMQRHNIEHIEVDSNGKATIRTVMTHTIGK